MFITQQNELGIVVFAYGLMGWMPFLPPNKQRQSTAGNTKYA